MKNRTLHISSPVGALRALMHGREVDLDSLLQIINNNRRESGFDTELKALSVLRSRAFMESAMAVEKRLGIPPLANPENIKTIRHASGSIRRLNLVYRSSLIRSVRGREGGAWLHPHLAITVLMHYAPGVTAEVADMLFSSGIFSTRENGGDSFNVMAEMVAGIFAAEGIKPQVGLAKLSSIIAARCCIEIRADNTTWDYASLAQLQARVGILESIIATVNANIDLGYPTPVALILKVAQRYRVPVFADTPNVGNPVTDTDVLANDAVSVIAALGANVAPPLSDDIAVCTISFEVDIDPVTGQWYSWDTYLPDGSLNLAREGAEFV